MSILIKHRDIIIYHCDNCSREEPMLGSSLDSTDQKIWPIMKKQGWTQPRELTHLCPQCSTHA